MQFLDWNESLSIMDDCEQENLMEDSLWWINPWSDNDKANCVKSTSYMNLELYNLTAAYWT